MDIAEWLVIALVAGGLISSAASAYLDPYLRRKRG